MNVLTSMKMCRVHDAIFYFFRLCRIYAIIAIKHDFVIIKIRYALGFQHSPRDLANVYKWRVMLDPHIQMLHQ